MKHIITLLVENQPGVLARVVGLISGRGYNIETLNVGPTHHPERSRMTMTVPGDDHVLKQVTKQLNKLVDVIKVTDLTTRRYLNRELILVEVAAPADKRGELVQLAGLQPPPLIQQDEPRSSHEGRQESDRKDPNDTPHSSSRSSASD